MKKTLPLLCCLFFMLSGCSVFMAAMGEEEKDTSFLRIGANRLAVEFHLGKPYKVVANDDGTTTHIFQYERGNEPSLGRAVGHGALDLITLGLWEIIGTPIEAVAGETLRLLVTYDKNDKVSNFRSLN